MERLDSLKGRGAYHPAAFMRLLQESTESVAIANQLPHNTRHNMSYQPDLDDIIAIEILQISHGMPL
jgi:hypothetical protein